jgi:acyl-CoA reductase-like NAD-dependent aldehyde dehydrogenase
MPPQGDIGSKTSEEDKHASKKADHKDTKATNNDTGSTPHASQLRKFIDSSLNEILTSRLQTERDEIVRRVIDHLQPRIERAAAEAAAREVDKFIEAAQGETVREKMQNILIRVHELPDAELETLFLRRQVMTDALRRLLRRVELEEADGDWQDIAPGHGAGSP